MKNLTRFLGMTLLASFLLTATLPAQDPVEPPEGIPPDSDYLYRQHYAQIEEILKSPLGEREKKLETFYQKVHPQAKIRQYIPGFLGQIVQEYQQAGRAAEAQALTNRIYELFPHLKPSPEQEMQAAFQSQDYGKAIEIGEKLDPTPQTTAILASSYIATQNQPKAVEYSQKAAQALGPKDGAYYHVWLGDYYANQQDIPSALKYYDPLLKAHPNEPPQGWEAGRFNGIRAKAMALKGGQHYLEKDYKNAIEAYYGSLRYAPENEQAYLFIGLSHWRQQELDEAMGAFALAAVMDKPGSAKAREYLEQIYKGRNQDSLEGLEDLLAEARSKLKGNQ